MKGDAKVIGYLNKVLYNELTAINQYFLHAKMLKNWGLKELGEHAYKASIDEMKHADALAERILFLEGLPNFQALGKLRIGEGPRETLECDLATELEALPLLREAVAHADAVGDYVSGPNHVLPTARSARFSSGLSVMDFLKRTTIARLTPAALAEIGPAAVRLSQMRSRCSRYRATAAFRPLKPL